MKKIIVIALVFAASFKISAQETTSFNETNIKWGNFTSTIVVTNTSLISDVIISPVEKKVMGKMYRDENWGTLSQPETFTPSIKTNTALFWYVHRITDLGTTKKAGETSEEEILSMPQKDNEVKLLLVNVEFTDPVSGTVVKKLVQVEAMPSDAEISEPVKSKFFASLTNEVLGLNTLKFVCENEIKTRVELVNEDLGLKIVLKNEKEKTILAPNQIPDGLYQFEARVETSLDIPPVKMKVELFLEDGKLSFSKNAVNSFFLEDKEKVFQEKVVNVRFRNTRSEAITIYVPKRCVVAQKTFGSKSSAMELSSGDFEYFAFTLQPGKSKILKTKSGLIRTVVYNGRTSRLFNVSVTEDNFCNAKY